MKASAASYRLGVIRRPPQGKPPLLYGSIQTCASNLVGGSLSGHKGIWQVQEGGEAYWWCRGCQQLPPACLATRAGFKPIGPVAPILVKYTQHLIAMDTIVGFVENTMILIFF